MRGDGRRRASVDLIAPGTGAIAAPENDPDAVAALLRGYRDDPARAARRGRGRAPERAAAMHDADAVGAPVERCCSA